MCYTLHTHREEMKGGIKVGYAVVHMMKIKSGAVGGIQSHNNREHEPKTNPDVKMYRSKDNYDLVPCDNYKRSIKEKLSSLVESSRAVRKDAVVVCNFIVTSDSETMDALGADRQRKFFEDSVRWFSDRYGADRVLNATVHMDESTPHLHIGVMPITQDGRLSAKAIFTKTEMKAIQTEFARDVGAKYGLERGVEGSERTHLSEARFKEEKALEMANEYGAIAQELQVVAEDYKQELSEATRSLEVVKNDIQGLESKKMALQGEIVRLEEVKNKADQTMKQVHEVIKQQKPILLDLKEQISEAKSELSVIETAIKEKKTEGEALFTVGGMAERIERARKEAGKDKRIKTLEARISLFERFISLPQIKPLWEQFQQLIGKNKSRKVDRER
ncbi:MobV family relaxase [Gemmiger sp.]